MAAFACARKKHGSVGRCDIRGCHKNHRHQTLAIALPREAARKSRHIGIRGLAAYRGGLVGRGAKKSPAQAGLRGAFGLGAWRFPTFAWQTATLSSALGGFTSEFGMGSGGSRPLWSPSKRVWSACRPTVIRQVFPASMEICTFCALSLWRCQLQPGLTPVWASPLPRISRLHNPSPLGVIWSSLTGN